MLAHMHTLQIMMRQEEVGSVPTASVTANQQLMHCCSRSIACDHIWPVLATGKECALQNVASTGSLFAKLFLQDVADWWHNLLQSILLRLT